MRPERVPAVSRQTRVSALQRSREPHPLRRANDRAARWILARHLVLLRRQGMHRARRLQVVEGGREDADGETQRGRKGGARTGRASASQLQPEQHSLSEGPSNDLLVSVTQCRWCTGLSRCSLRQLRGWLRQRGKRLPTMRIACHARLPVDDVDPLVVCVPHLLHSIRAAAGHAHRVQ